MKEKLDDFLKKALVNYDLPGLAVGIRAEAEGAGRIFSGRAGGYDTDGGRAAFSYQNAVGFRDLAGQKLLRPGDIFHMASVTKLFVGTSILQLWERGLIRLDGLLTDYLPWFRMKDERYGEITIRHLLSHTSGMPDVKDYCWDSPETDGGALERYVRSDEVREASLLWAPGERKFSYSNIGYEILGAVIAAVSGMPFEDYVRRNIFEPLDMSSSTLLSYERGIYDEKGPDDNLCAPHEKDAEKRIVKVVHFPYNRAHGPSSTLTSNVADLGKWGEAHLKHRLLEKETYDLAWEKQALVPNNGEFICLSWFRREQNGFVLYGHEGTDNGFRASFWLCPELELSITVCSNISGAPVKKINKQVFDLVIGG
ncbi:MAG TPA: serine hydrolase domain-containing protein [Bacillota bacterium]|nr:serine hydrolase domain-containing protein [Bacillota bacterium]